MFPWICSDLYRYAVAQKEAWSWQDTASHPALLEKTNSNKVIDSMECFFLGFPIAEKVQCE